MKKFLFIMVILISGCSIDKKIDYAEKNDNEIFQLGFENLKKKHYIVGMEDLGQIEYNYPYSKYVPQSWYLMGYANYREKNYAEAISNFEKLIKFQPSHPQVPYALYMVAMSYYDQMSPISRDQKMTELALSYMEKLNKNFPETEYAQDVQPKIIIARNHLAAKEMYIAKNLVKKKNLIAALNRFQTVIIKYQTTLAVEEALFRTVEIYLMLDEVDVANNVLRLLEVNYPNSVWYKAAKSLFKR